MDQTHQLTKMKDTVSQVIDSSTAVQWMWNMKQNSSDEFVHSRWIHYSDTENRIIEEAFAAKKTQIIRDNNCIDFKSMSQTSINKDGQQRLVRLVIYQRDEKCLREKDPVPDSILPLWQFNGSYGWNSVFIQEVRKSLKFEKRQLPSRDKTIIPMIVEKAALGIIEEGEKIGKSNEAERIAGEFLKQRDKEIEEVWVHCAHLYSNETFLYKILNQTMRLIGTKEYAKVWKSKIDTLGPFCLLLWDDPFNNKPNTSNQLLYRGTKLSAAMIDAFKNRSSNECGTFQAFTSCTPNRSLAETFGNTLFIMKVKYAFTMDISPFSSFPAEEEVLISPGVCFIIDRVDLDESTNKHLIYLELDHRLGGEYESYKNIDLENLKISKELKGTTSNNAFAADNYFVLRDRDGDIIADDIDAHILRVHHCDLSADYYYFNVLFGLARPICKPFGTRLHVYIRPPAATSRRNTLVRSRLRLRSPDDNADRPHSPDNIYRLGTNN